MPPSDKMGHPKQVTAVEDQFICDVGRMQHERLTRIRNHMAAQDVAAVLLLHGPHIAYASGHVSPAVDTSWAAMWFRSRVSRSCCIRPTSQMN